MSNRPNRSGLANPILIGAITVLAVIVAVFLANNAGNGLPFGGIKVIAESGWFAARPSGTEDLYKIYAESFRSEDHLRQIQQSAQDAIARLFGAGEPA